MLTSMNQPRKKLTKKKSTGKNKIGIKEKIQLNQKENAYDNPINSEDEYDDRSSRGLGALINNSNNNNNNNFNSSNMVQNVLINAETIEEVSVGRKKKGKNRRQVLKEKKFYSF